MADERPVIPGLDTFVTWWISQPQLNIYPSDHPIFIAAEMAWNAAQRKTTQIAMCDIAGRLKFTHDIRGIRYGYSPDWIVPGTILYTITD